jgi:hypothetical protein
LLRFVNFRLAILQLFTETRYLKPLFIFFLLFYTVHLNGQVSNEGKWQGQNLDSLMDSNPNSFDLSGDSLFQNFRNSIISIDSPHNNLLNSTKKADSLIKPVEWLPSVKGQLELGYQYGLLTGYIDPYSTAPLSVFNTRGDFSMEALKLPLNVSYNYSSFKNPLGVNNYFRASLDTEKLKQNANSKKNEAIGELDDSFDEIGAQKDLVQRKMGMGEVLLQKYKRQMTQSEEQLKAIEGKLDKKINSVDLESRTQFEDQNLNNKEIDSLRRLHENAEEYYNRARYFYDTINNVYQKALSIYKSLSQLQDQLNAKKSTLNSLSNNVSTGNLKNQVLNKEDGFISNIKTLDIGLSYPKTTALSNNSVPIQGVNFEMQRENLYLAFSSGVTMNNLMVSTDAVQNKLNNSQNLFNQFDFQNIKERGWLTAIKTGYGTKESTHIHFGVRYLTKSIPLSGNLNDSTAIPSLGGELDIRWIPKFSKNTKIDFVYGKTSYRQALQDSLRTNTLSSLFSLDQTNTALLCATQNLSKLRTNVTSSIRWIDPYADVRSLGVLQPDNFRYEARSSTSLTQGIRLGLNYRHDRNNVWNQKDSTIRLNVIGGQLNGNIGKTLSYFMSINYLTQSTLCLNSKNSKNNYMLGIGMSTNYSVGHLKNAVSLSYNDYLITDSISTGLFRNVSIQHLTKMSAGVNKLAIGYFQMKDDIQPENASLIFSDEFSFQKNKLQLTLGLKIAKSQAYGSDLGGKIESSYRITKNLEWTLRAEKLVLGDFYNYYSRDRFDRFPFAITTRMNFIFN